jgi:ABC-type sugar transport system ATPase subunit
MKQVLEVRDVSKRYGKTIALSQLSLTAKSGEILGIAGPNGAGKSTLIKILSGDVELDSGSITIKDENGSESSPISQVAVVHQELQIYPNLSVIDNFLIVRENQNLLRPKSSKKELDMLEEMGLTKFKNRILGELPLAVAQRVEIGRALLSNALIFLFDEPNSALTPEESQDLFHAMHHLKDLGHIVLFITHRLAELVEHSDRVQLIIDGKADAFFEGSALTAENIATHLVMEESRQRGSQQSKERVFENNFIKVKSWTHHRDTFKSLDLEIRSGEIIAIVGVEGSGGRELIRSLAGVEKASGIILIDNEVVDPKNSGFAFVSANRESSIFANLTLGENLVIRHGSSISNKIGWLSNKNSKVLASESKAQYTIKSDSLDLNVKSLSGGNQQKVAIASALSTMPVLALLEEPTRGVDMSSKADIYALLKDHAKGKSAVVILCTEESEVYDVADRACVMHLGELVGEIDISACTDLEDLARKISKLTHKESKAAS